MSKELELCPMCKKGKLHPTGDVSTRELVCDTCGHRRTDVGLNEYL